ncbi:MAG: hypothetical protein QM809_18875 [Gordonia sp. (in: high G+C Gram-positive bacteria)]|uniref:hypothetical protein n=1 Tax=Gordonia sp. (in: high G+C Gram-positive bacteria) TaxID=84139 RepID=UPI0039E4B9E6
MVGRLERNKDLIQDVVENTARGVGSIASIITDAVADVTREIGDIVTDGLEMREAAKAAKLAERTEERIEAEAPTYDDEPAPEPVTAESVDAPAPESPAVPAEPVPTEPALADPAEPQLAAAPVEPQLEAAPVVEREA